VLGVEPSTDAAAVARRRGAKVLEGTLATVELASESVDAAVFSHSLEHVIDPQLDLRRVYEALRPAGRLAVMVPNWDSWQRRAFAEHWFPLELPRHRTHFSAQGLREALHAAGFSEVVVQAGTPLITTTWSLQFRVFDRCLTKSGATLLAGYVASVPISLMTLVVDRLLGSGDFLHAAASRPAD
jgi:SAM-dependent methyltransferase